MIIALAMTVIIGMAAFAIDVGQWYLKRHQAQVVADAAALAAANCLASTACQQTTQTGDAHGVATDPRYSQGGVTVTSVSFTSSDVKVTAQGTASAPFAGVLGISAPTVSASATASYSTRVQAPTSVYGADCSNPTDPPTSGCTVDCTHHGVTINANGNTTVSGAIETNGEVDINIGGTASLGPVEYGQPGGTNCVSHKVSVSGNATIADGPSPAPAAVAFPTTYNAVWTSATTNMCTASSTYTASGYTGYKDITTSGGTSTIPSTITLAGNNKTFGSSATPVVMCASTSISIPGNSATLDDITLVAPSITIGGNNFTITADPNALPDDGGSPAVALYDTSTTTLTLPTNGVTVTGAVYAPEAEIDLLGNNGGQALLEGNRVVIDGNNSGDGPTTTLTAFPGNDQLTQ